MNMGRDIELDTNTETDEETRWMLRARCRGADPSEFFPSDGVGVDEARRICGECPVQMECLEYALRYRIDHGVWGGCSERERRRILKRRRQEAREREARQAEAADESP